MVTVKALPSFRQHERGSCHACDMLSFFHDLGAQLTEYLATLTVALEDVTRGCGLLISEVKVCFLDRHNNIISHLTRFVKNFFSSMISSRYPTNMVAGGRHNTRSSVKALARDPA